MRRAWNLIVCFFAGCDEVMTEVDRNESGRRWSSWRVVLFSWLL